MNSHYRPDMKLDWNLMRVILAHIESETIKEFLNDANSLSEWKEGQLLSDRRDQKQDPSVREVYSHIKMLAEGGYIEGLHVQESLDGFFDIGISANPSLTLDGHALLETLRTNGFIDKLRAFAKEKSAPLTFESFKLVSAALLPTLLK